MKALESWADSGDPLVLGLGLLIVFFSLYFLADFLRQLDGTEGQQLIERAFRHLGGIESFQRQALIATTAAAGCILVVLLFRLWHHKMILLSIVAIGVLNSLPYLNSRR